MTRLVLVICAIVLVCSALAFWACCVAAGSYSRRRKSGMAFKIVNETYTTLPGENPEKHGYVEGYTSNTVGATYLRLNVMSVPDEEQYNTYKRTNCLRYFEYKVGQKYGTGVRLNRKQVVRLIWELFKWLVRGW